ncbi:hypothetical protein MUK42_34215 [Musa troglodytarum]|nr:hypothetical protein MUK42_34215 [Musa troglodytarum]
MASLRARSPRPDRPSSASESFEHLRLDKYHREFPERSKAQSPEGGVVSSFSSISYSISHLLLYDLKKCRNHMNKHLMAFFQSAAKWH